MINDINVNKNNDMEGFCSALKTRSGQPWRAEEVERSSRWQRVLSAEEREGLLEGLAVFEKRNSPVAKYGRGFSHSWNSGLD